MQRVSFPLRRVQRNTHTVSVDSILAGKRLLSDVYSFPVRFCGHKLLIGGSYFELRRLCESQKAKMVSYSKSSYAKVSYSGLSPE